VPYATTLDRPQYGLTALAEQLLPALYRHRLMTARRLHLLLQPHVPARCTCASSSVSSATATWPTPSSATAAAARANTPGTAPRTKRTPWKPAVNCPPGPYRMTERNASSQLQEHTPAVNDTGVAFVAAARAAGHDCGPLDWEHEVAHRLRDGETRADDDAFVTPDTVLSYLHRRGQRPSALTYFLENDRTTESPTQLVDKLRAYARYQARPVRAPSTARTPRTDSVSEGWRSRYAVFPMVLFVLTADSDAVLARRTVDVRTLAAADARLRRASHRLPAGITTLRQAQMSGPWGLVVTPLFGDTATPAKAMSYGTPRRI
jgi:hypothetical protein